MKKTKILPHDKEVEQAVLGGMLINSKCISKVHNIINSNDFYSQTHKFISTAIFELKKAADLITVQDFLMSKDLLEKCGGRDYLVELAGSVSISAGIENYCQIVKNLAIRRRIIEQCSLTADNAFNLTVAVDENLSKHNAAVRALHKGEKDYREIDICHVYDAQRMLDEYRAYIQDLKKNRFITGITEIDKRIRGVAGGEVLTIIARAGSFKTAILQNLLKNYVQNSAWGAIFFSIEMPIPSVTERYQEMIQGCSGLDVERFYRSKESGANEFVSKLENDFIKELKNLFVVPVKVGISDISAYIKLIEHEFSVKIGVIGIDYLGLMDGPGVGEYEIVSRLSRDVKSISKRINLPVILLSQVSRKGGSGYDEINLDHARGSGAIEEGADFVLGLWQAEREKGLQESIINLEPEYDLICRILKNRKGPVMSTWKLALNANTLRIGSEAEAYKVIKKRKFKEYNG